jgi:hypothetical protein
MSQYREGTVSVTNGSQTVTGVGTSWLAEVASGDLFVIVGQGIVYQVAAVGSNTSITLAANYAGTSGSGLSYVVARDFTPINNIPIINRGDFETAALLTRAMQIIDGLL